MRSLRGCACGFALAVHDGELVGRREAASAVSASDAVSTPVEIAARVARAVSARELRRRPGWRTELCARSPRHSARAMVSGGYQPFATGQRARLCVWTPEGYDGSSTAGNLPGRGERCRFPLTPPKKRKYSLALVVRVSGDPYVWTMNGECSRGPRVGKYCASSRRKMSYKIDVRRASRPCGPVSSIGR